jgi:MoxR-like ATPase
METEAEIDVIYENSRDLKIESLSAVTDGETVTSMIDYASTVNVAREVARFIVELVKATRTDPALALGASPRASIALIRAARVLAATDGRADVYPDDVLTVLDPVLNHRLILSPDSAIRGETVAAAIDRIRTSVKPPSRSPGLSSLPTPV